MIDSAHASVVEGMKMSLLERLVPDGERENITDVLMGEKLPLFVWGSGNVAELVQKYLKENGIRITGFFEWPRVFHGTFHGRKVYSLEEVEQCYPCYNVIVGHSHYSKGEELSEHASNINRIFYLFSFDYCGCNFNTFFDRNILMENMEVYEVAYRCLADQKSRDCLAAFFNTKLTGNVGYVFEVFDKEMDIFGNDIYAMDGDECYWNIGGGKGETIAEFLDNTDSRFNQIVTLEPNPESYECLCKYTDSLPFHHKIFKYQKAAWNEREKIRFYHDDDVVQSGRIGVKASKEAEWVDGISLDELLLENESLLPPTFITANYFDGMAEMLAGCGLILKNHMPKLAIVVGHNDECGILRAVEAILGANPEYKLYLRFNQALATTLVLYGYV